MATVNLTVAIQAVGGPQVNLTRSVPIEAYDKIEIEVPPGGAAAPFVTVEIQPGAAAKVVMLSIQSTILGAELTYVASDGASDSVAVTLDQPQVYVGNSVSLFKIAPKLLKFKNTHAAADPSKTAVVEIFVGRKAL
jgi:hypothetical protein